MCHVCADHSYEKDYTYAVCSSIQSEAFSFGLSAEEQISEQEVTGVLTNHRRSPRRRRRRVPKRVAWTL